MSAMPKTKKTKPPQARKTAKRKPAPQPEAETSLAPDDTIITSSTLSLHQLFEQQTARMLDRADLSEEQKQSILIGLNCPCCGAGGFSFTAKLRR
jgi:apolipoprotein N-acyltransferase